MKILRLDLLAFGPFTDQSLAFEPSRGGLHVVYGPNEAGKSSSLRALRHWLYGIPHSCNDSFLHPNKNLRIGGVLEDARGRRFEFIRRKGRDKTVRGPDDVRVLEESDLARILGGVDEKTFQQRFGMGYEELRRGGLEISQGEGELGAILFAAGAGIVDVRQVRERIETDMQNLFKPNGTNQTINKRLAELSRLRELMKSVQLPTSKWLEQDKALRLSQQRLTETEAELREKRARQSRLDRMQKAFPLLRRRRRLEEQLVAVQDAPLLPGDFAELRAEAMAKLASDQQSDREARGEITRLKDAMSEVTIPTALLEHRTAITQLHSAFGGIDKAARDRPGVLAEQQKAEGRARDILVELGREPDLQKAQYLRITRTQRQRIQMLAGEFKARLQKQASAEAAIAKLLAEIQKAEESLARHDSAGDPTRLSAVLRKARKQGDLDQLIADAQSALRELETQSELELKRLPLFHGTLEELEALPICAAETIDRFDKDLLAAQSGIDKICERIERITDQIQTIEARLQSLRMEQDVPTEDDLRDARHRRDEGWSLVRQALKYGLRPEEPSIEEFVEQFAPGGHLESAFTASMEAADAVADRLRREVGRVAEKTKLSAEHQKEERRLQTERENLASARLRKDDLLSQWRQLWIGLGIDPLSPREMQSWRGRQSHLADTARSIRKQREVVGGLEQRRNSLREELLQTLVENTSPAPVSDGALMELVESCESHVLVMETSNRDRMAGERKLAELRDQLSEAREADSRAKSDLRQWQIDWAAAVEVLRLTPDSAPAEVNAAMELVDELMERIKTSEGLRQRLEGIDSDGESFRQSFHCVIEEVAADLRDIPIAQSVADLRDRLELALKNEVKLDQWAERMAAEQSKLDKACAAIEQQQRTIRSMCAQANCESPELLPTAEARSAERRDIEAQLRSLKDQLDDLAEGESSESFFAELQKLDADQCAEEAGRLANAITELESAWKETSEAIGGHRVELKRMDGNAHAAEARQEAEQVLTAIREDAEQYIRLRLAAAVLARSIERFREASQGSVLRRAGELFAEMSLGSFGGLRADYDEKGKATLVGVRADGGQTVGVDGMSDGTCDQLFLALRLALLEKYLDENEPLPFIIDDILIKFDDDRAAAALKTLARLGERTQVIYFTHHEHLMDIACEYLDDGAFFTYRLGDRHASANLAP